MKHHGNRLDEIRSEMQYLVIFLPVSPLFLSILRFRGFMKNPSKPSHRSKKISRYCISERISTRAFQRCFICSYISSLHQFFWVWVIGEWGALPLKMINFNTKQVKSFLTAEMNSSNPVLSNGIWVWGVHSPLSLSNIQSPEDDVKYCK